MWSECEATVLSTVNVPAATPLQVPVAQPVGLTRAFAAVGETSARSCSIRLVGQQLYLEHLAGRRAHLPRLNRQLPRQPPQSPVPLRRAHATAGGGYKGPFAMPHLDDPLPLQLAVNPDDRRGIDRQRLRQLADRRQLVFRLQRARRDVVFDLVNHLPVHRHARMGIDLKMEHVVHRPMFGCMVTAKH